MHGVGLCESILAAVGSAPRAPCCPQCQDPELVGGDELVLEPITLADPA